MLIPSKSYNITQKGQFSLYLEKINIDLKIILLDHQNNYVENPSMMSNAAKSFDILVISSSILHNF